MRGFLLATVIFISSPVWAWGPGLLRGYQLDLDPAFDARIDSDPANYEFDVVLERLESHISRAQADTTDADFSGHEHLLPAYLAGLIATAAECFHLDPYVFASLIHQESAFRRDAKSQTGAMGLTQMTGIAITEVADQLGFGGEARATETSRRYFNGVIDTCIVPNLLGGGVWEQVWERPAVRPHRPYTPAWLHGHKIELVADPVASVVYGAIVLKTNLTAVRQKDGKSPIGRVYRNALRRYNGDPAIKESYQARVMSMAQRMLSRD